MASNIDSGFGANCDSILGEAPTLLNTQVGFGEFRARSIYSTNGALITSVHISPRNGIAGGYDFPPAAMYAVFGIVSLSQMDVTQMNFQKATDVRQIAESIFLMTSRSTLVDTDILLGDGGVYIPPQRWAHIFCVAPRTSVGGNAATYFELSVTGRQLASGELPYKLR